MPGEQGHVITIVITIVVTIVATNLIDLAPTGIPIGAKSDFCCPDFADFYCPDLYCSDFVDICEFFSVHFCFFLSQPNLTENVHIYFEREEGEGNGRNPT